VELGEDLISLVCLVLNAIALVRCISVETWMPLNVGGWGIYSPNHQKWSLEVCCRMAHRTVRCASHVSRSLGSTVGALTCGASGLSGGAPDRSCRLSGAPTARALTLARTVAH
jgi:hypothetical protein